MPRTTRMKDMELGAWYHIHSHIAGHAAEYLLSAAAPIRRLLEIIKGYSRIYFCEVPAWCVRSPQGTMSRISV